MLGVLRNEDNITLLQVKNLVFQEKTELTVANAQKVVILVFVGFYSAVRDDVAAVDPQDLYLFDDASLPCLHATNIA